MAAGGSTKDPEPALDTAREVLTLCGARFVGAALSMHTDRIPAAEDLDARDQVRRLAALLREGGHPPIK